MWDWDRLHMSPSGHENMATRVLDVLGVEHGLTPPDLGPAPVLTKAETRREDRQWAREFLVPWVARRVKGTSSGDGVSAKQPQLSLRFSPDSCADGRARPGGRWSRVPL